MILPLTKYYPPPFSTFIAYVKVALLMLRDEVTAPVDRGRGAFERVFGDQNKMKIFLHKVSPHHVRERRE